MSFDRYFFPKRRDGAIIITTIIILFTSLGAIATALAVTNKTFENQTLITKSVKRENIACQALSVVEKWFIESVNSGQIPAPRNSVYYEEPNESPVYILSSQQLNVLLERNQESEIIGYVVDAYYKVSTDEIDRAEALFIEPHSFVINDNETKNSYTARHYFINVFTALNTSDKDQLHLSKEILVLRNKYSELSFVPLSSKKQLIKKTNN